MVTKIEFIDKVTTPKEYPNCYPSFLEGGNVLILNCDTHKLEDKIPDWQVKVVTIRF